MVMEEAVLSPVDAEEEEVHLSPSAAPLEGEGCPVSGVLG